MWLHLGDTLSASMQFEGRQMFPVSASTSTLRPSYSSRISVSSSWYRIWNPVSGESRTIHFPIPSALTSEHPVIFERMFLKSSSSMPFASSPVFSFSFYLLSFSFFFLHFFSWYAFKLVPRRVNLWLPIESAQLITLTRSLLILYPGVLYFLIDTEIVLGRDFQIRPFSLALYKNSESFEPTSSLKFSVNLSAALESADNFLPYFRTKDPTYSTGNSAHRHNHYFANSRTFSSYFFLKFWKWFGSDFG